MDSEHVSEEAPAAGGDPDRRMSMTVVVECECGWSARGDERTAIEMAQVHQRVIHGQEISREELMAGARPRRDRTSSEPAPDR